MNRGWRLDQKPNRMKLWEYWSYRALGLIGRIGVAGRFIMSLEWGSPFVVDLRLQWLRLGARNVLPLTVQVLGDWDDMVIRDDALDAGVIGLFAIIPVAATGHYQLTKFDPRRVGSISTKTVDRYSGG